MTPDMRPLLLSIVLVFAAIAGHGQCTIVGATNTSGCAGSVTLNATSDNASVSTHRWYTTQTGGSPLSGVTVNNPTGSIRVSSITINTASSITYWVAAVCGISEGARVAATYTISASTLSVTPSTNPSSFCQGSTITATGASNLLWSIGTSASDPNPVSTGLTASTITPTQSGYYFLRYTDNCETKRVALFPLTLTTRINASTSPTGNVKIKRTNGSVTLSGLPANAAYYYLWYKDGTLQSGSASTLLATQPGNYTAVISNNGCTGQTSPPVSIALNILPVVDVELTRTVSLPTSSVTLTASISDPDGTIAARAWSQTSGPATAALTGQTTSSLTASNLVKGTYVFRISATDETGETTSKNVTVNVLEPPNNYNWIRETVVQVRGQTTDAQVTSLSLSLNEKTETWSYFDGLGRPMQTVSRQASPNRKDMVQPVAYDQFGREQFRYLPYESEKADGTYQSSFLADQLSFYQNTPSVAQDSKPFSQTLFEESPLNRPLKQGSPGSAWQPNNSPYADPTDRTTAFAYQVNEANQIRLWTYTYPNAAFPFGKVSAGTPSVPAYYGQGALLVNKSKNERGHEQIEYVDKEGRTVLKRIQAVDGATTVSNHNYASTYYIYDDFGSLVSVIPPEATSRLAAEYFQSGLTDVQREDFLDLWAFRYAYDGRRRMTMKKVPGAKAVYMVYDQRDRVVLTQDGNQRSRREWSYTKYDALNRPIITGVYTHGLELDQVAMQNHVNTETVSGTDFYEDYNDVIATHGYTNRTFPYQSIEPLTVTYYDDYDFKSLWSDLYGYVPEVLSQVVSGETYDYPTAPNLLVKGQVTGTKVKVLDGGTTGGLSWLNTATYYDDKYRVIQTTADNYKSGTDRTSNLYDFTGKLWKTRVTHQERDFTWKDVVGVNQRGNKLLRFAGGSTWGTAGAASVQLLPANQDGWIKWTASETNTQRVVGFSAQNPDEALSSIDYGWVMNANGTLQVHQEGEALSSAIPYSSGDVLLIKREGNLIRFFQNNVAIAKTITVASRPALMADIAFFTSGATLINIASSFARTTQTVNKTYTYDHAGRLKGTWHQLDTGPNLMVSKNEYNELGQLIDKKLHSTTSTAADARQSVDYRYNIRGWLTFINNPSLTNDGTNNDDATDYFGMSLKYNEVDASLNNQADFSGNISGVKWSNYGGGAVTGKGYSFKYDALNRLTRSVYKQKTTAWGDMPNTGNGEYDITYDLNGNIEGLKRNDHRSSGLMDNLTYAYQGNQLSQVTDGGDDLLGFADGNTGAADYAYDANGNMITDLNKGISTSIVYNLLNLPEVVSRGDNSVRYIYDATGRKLAQNVRYGSNTTQTDYCGEFIYRNDKLQLINHDEGRVVMAKEELLYQNACESVADFTAVGAGVAVSTDSKYIRIASTQITGSPGAYPIGPGIPVAPGERYLIRARGYTVGTSQAYLIIRGNNVALDWPGAALPKTSTAESWTEQVVIIPAGVQVLDAGVAWKTVAVNEKIFLSDFEIIKLEDNSPEYQYHLKDHLGNVRLTFTTRNEQDIYTATLESSTQDNEQATFRNYSRVTNDLFDHTDAGTLYDRSLLLNGGNNSQIGLAKTLSVMPGDTINVSVYVKYFGSTGAAGNLTNYAATLLSAFGLPTPAPSETGTAAAAIQEVGTFIAGGGKDIDPTPKGFLNIIVFDKDHNLVDLAYQQTGTAGEQPAGSSVKQPHALLQRQVIIRQPGFVYIYLSNEGPVMRDIYFDDLQVRHQKSKIVQMDDYYPFGLTFNSYSRENTVYNSYQFNKKEIQNELSLGWNDFGARMYLSDIGRWNSLDYPADVFDDESPYSFGANNPINVIDIGGHFRISAEFANKYPTLTKLIAWYLPLLKTNRTVKNAWTEVTGGTADQFDDMVTYGSGPEIVPTQPEKATFWSTNDPFTSEDNQFDPDHPNKLFLAPTSLNELELEMAKAAKGEENQLGAQMFLVSLKVLHEAVHYGVFRHRGKKNFYNLEGSGGPLGGDQGSRWEGRAFKRRFSYRSELSPAMDRNDVFEYYKSNFSEPRMRGMTLHQDFFYNYMMLMGPTPISNQSKTASPYHPHKFHGPE